MSFEMTFEGANRRWLPVTEWDGIPNCWSCMIQCIMQVCQWQRRLV